MSEVLSRDERTYYRRPVTRRDSLASWHDIDRYEATVRVVEVERDAAVARAERLENLLDDLVKQAEAAGMTVSARFNAELREVR